MIIDFYGNGGGSGSGVTPEEVQAQIDSALTEYTPTSGFSTINGSAITDGSAIEIDADLTDYWTSAQTEEAISAATSGKADASSVSANTDRTLFPTWNSQGIITGAKAEASDKTVKVNGSTFHFYSSEGFDLPSIYSPNNAGNAGEVLVSTGGRPVWSAVTIPDLSGYWTSAQTQSALDAKQDVIVDLDSIRSGAQAGSTAVQPAALADYVDNTELQSTLSGYYTSAQTDNLISNFVSSADVKTQIDSALTVYTPTDNFATINGSAITNGDNLVIDADLSGYWNSAETQTAINTATSGLATSAQIYTVEYTVSVALNELHTEMSAITAACDNFVTSAQVETQITNKGYATSANVNTALASYTPTSGFSTINGSAITNGGNIVIEGGGDLSNYWDSAQTQAHIDSAYTSATTHIEDVERVAAIALNELHNEVAAISGASENYITSAYVNTALASYTPTSGFSTINGSAITAGGNLVIEGGGDLSAYWTSAQTQTAITTATANMVSSTTVTNIWRGTQADYDLIDPKDPNALYIILAS